MLNQQTLIMRVRKCPLASLLADGHFLLKTRDIKELKVLRECPCRDCREAARPYRECN